MRKVYFRLFFILLSSGYYSTACLSQSIGIGSNQFVPALTLEVKAPSEGLPANTGIAETGILRLSQNSGDMGVLDFGFGSTATGAYVQATNSGALGTHYSLLLNPNGGNVGINTSTPGTNLEVKGNANIDVNLGVGAGGNVSPHILLNTGGLFFDGSSNAIFGISSQPTLVLLTTNQTANVYGISTSPGINGFGNNLTATNLFGVYSTIEVVAQATVTNLYNYYAVAPVISTSTVTNVYGLYLENMTGGTTNYAIYSAGGKNYFAGNVSLGTTPNYTALLNLNGGHLRSQQTTAPAIAVTMANGITAAAVATGSTDMKGIVTTTGTNNGTNTVLTITFNGSFTVAPVVIISPANASAQSWTYFVNSGTTTFTINFSGGGATPSFNYMVIE